MSSYKLDLAEKQVTDLYQQTF